MLYRLLRPLLYLLPAETAHHLVLGGMALLGRLPGGRALLRALFGAPHPSLRVRAWGRELASPIGLAAGLDKDATAFAALSALGFGFVEVGTLTALAQPGNPRPRLFRLVRDRALINRMGFNNRGAADAVSRLSRRREGTTVGVNIGKTKRVRAEDAVADYGASARALGPRADYLVINVSSPNTPGLRDMQAVEQLRPLLSHVRQTLDAAVPGRRVPLLCKIAPDLADQEIDAIADLALELELDGLIATNTTISREGLQSEPGVVARAGSGGLSGAPLARRSLAVLRRLRQRVGDRLILISVGGIESAQDVEQRLRAGATLVQLYTALIYQGPGLPSRLNAELASLLRRQGLGSVGELVGRVGQAE